MPGLVKYCDVVMGNLWAAEKMLGIAVDTGLVNEKCKQEDYLEHARLTSEKIVERFPGTKIVAKTFRFDHRVQRGSIIIRRYSRIRSYTTRRPMRQKRYWTKWAAGIVSWRG